ncbi:MAG: hypothetical protein JST00_04415 [Deltaproteobacteria bacterium]|nr:hypothetical protein [Deltaproteobacteria bacterium]
MKRTWFVLALVAPAFGAWIAGCGDDELFVENDAGSFDAGGLPEAGDRPDTGSDGGGNGLGCGSSAGAPPRVLLSMNNTSTSEIVAFNLTDEKVDGKLGFPSALGFTSSQGTDPYLLQASNDIVARLDPKDPTKVVSRWSVRGDDAKDGGLPNANPVSLVVPSCSKGYVVRYNRNKIAVIDTTKASDAGAADAYIDLAPLLQAEDKDGLVEATAAIHVPSKKRIYVLLGNVDFTKIATDGFTALCASTKPSIVGLDDATGAVVSLGGAGPSGSILLQGYNPFIGSFFHYDPARERLLVWSGGCNADDGDGGAGPIVRRRVEEVDLATGAVKTLLDLDGTFDYPSGMAFADGTHAAIAFFGQAFFWDPTQPKLGPEIPGGLPFLTADGKGNVVGMRQVPRGDGGKGIDVLRVPFPPTGSDAGIDAAAVEKIGEDPFTNNGGFPGGIEAWPHK